MTESNRTTTRRVVTVIYLKERHPEYPGRLARLLLRKESVDLPIGHVFVGTDISADGASFFITDPARGDVYYSDAYDDGQTMVHDLITVLVEGLP